MEIGSHSGVSWVGCRRFRPNQAVMLRLPVFLTGYCIWMSVSSEVCIVTCCLCSLPRPPWLTCCLCVTTALSVSPHMQSLQRVLLSSLPASLGTLTASLWLGGVMGSLSAKTTAMNSIVPCAQSLSSSVPAGSALMVPFDAMAMRTARTNQMRRTVKVLSPSVLALWFFASSYLKFSVLLLLFLFVLAFWLNNLSFIFDYALHICC